MIPCFVASLFASAKVNKKRRERGWGRPPIIILKPFGHEPLNCGSPSNWKTYTSVTLARIVVIFSLDFLGLRCLHCFALLCIVILALRWGNFGIIVALRWSHVGAKFRKRRAQNGSGWFLVLAEFRKRRAQRGSGRFLVLAKFRKRRAQNGSGWFLGSSCKYLGIILRSSWHCVGFILASSWYYIGTILGSRWGHREKENLPKQRSCSG